jgi:hypothetical protein
MDNQSKLSSVAFLWLPSYSCLAFLWLPCVTYSYLWLPCATYYYILAETTLFIYHDLVSLAR